MLQFTDVKGNIPDDFNVSSMFILLKWARYGKELFDILFLLSSTAYQFVSLALISDMMGLFIPYSDRIRSFNNEHSVT